MRTVLVFIWVCSCFQTILRSQEIERRIEVNVTNKGSATGGPKQTEIEPSQADFNEGVAFAKRGNFSEAFKSFRRASELEHPQAQLRLAELFVDGRGAEVNAAEAKKWFDRAASGLLTNAKANDVVSMRLLGWMHYLGKGVPRNKEEAFKWLELAATYGDREASNYRDALVRGLTRQEFDSLKTSTSQFIQSQKEERLNQMRIAAEGGTIPARMAYAEQLVAQGDLAAALVWFEKAAAQGGPEAQVRAGLMHLKGQGTQPNDSKAAHFFEMASKLGHVIGQLHFAQCCFYGKGVNRDSEKAFHLFSRAAENGSAAAEYILGERYYLGIDVPKDYREAVKWFVRASGQGHAIAQYSLAQCFAFGRGVTIDYRQAAAWFIRAANQGDASAQREAAVLYSKGLGVALDEAESHKWLVLAAAQNDKKAYEYLQISSSLLSSRDVKQGDRRAAAFVPKKSSVTEAWEAIKLLWGLEQPF